MAYDQARADRICESLSRGLSLRKAAQAEGISHVTVLDWIRDIPGFSDQYARAREAGWALLADELVEISDRSESDTFIDQDGRERTNTEVVARSRLMVDTRKWLLSKMLPKVYGDKVTQEHTGPNGGPVSLLLQQMGKSSMPVVPKPDDE